MTEEEFNQAVKLKEEIKFLEKVLSGAIRYSLLSDAYTGQAVIQAKGDAVRILESKVDLLNKELREWAEDTIFIRKSQLAKL
jgi:hypothetical protein